MNTVQYRIALTLPRNASDSIYLKLKSITTGIPDPDLKPMKLRFSIPDELQLQMLSGSCSSCCKLWNLRNAIDSIQSIFNWLQRAEKWAESNDRQVEFRSIFSDQTIFEGFAEDSTDAFYRFLSIEDGSIPNTPEGEACPMSPSPVLFALNSAISQFLLNGQTYRLWNAETALVYCSWQAFAYARRIWLDHPPNWDDLSAMKESDHGFRHMGWYFLYDYLARQYKDVLGMLQNTGLTHAWRFLWQLGTGDSKTSVKRIRELVRLSLVLDLRNEREGEGPSTISSEPVSAPFFSKDKTSWEDVRPHAWLGEDDSAVKLLIRDFLVPRFDLVEAFRMAIVSQRDRGGLWLNVAWGEAIIYFAMITILLASFGPLLVIRVWQPSTEFQTYTKLASSIILQFALPLLLVSGGLFLKIHMRPLILPRLVAAILAGYLLGLLSEESWELLKVFGLIPGQGGEVKEWHLIGLWSGILLLTGSYFYYEAKVYADGFRYTLRRVLPVLLWSAALDIGVGSWVLQFSPDLYKDMGFSKDLIVGGVLTFIPLPALLVFGPMAMLVGVISQLLWQDKPVTESAWLPEER